MRPDEEIWADLAAMERTVMWPGSVHRTEATTRLLRDVPNLLAARDRALAEVALLRQPDRLAETAHQMAIRSPLLSPDDALRLLTNAAGFLSRIADLEAKHADLRHRVTWLHVWTNEDGLRFVYADDLAAVLAQDTARDETGGEG